MQGSGQYECRCGAVADQDVAVKRVQSCNRMVHSYQSYNGTCLSLVAIAVVGRGIMEVMLSSSYIVSLRQHQSWGSHGVLRPAVYVARQSVEAHSASYTFARYGWAPRLGLQLAFRLEHAVLLPLLLVSLPSRGGNGASPR